MNSIKNRIGKQIEINWKIDLLELQPEDVKVKTNKENLKSSILKYGFALPFAVWLDGGKYYCVDGHTRKEILLELEEEGVEIPEKLKAFEVEAKDRKEAIEILLEVYNQKHNPFDAQSMLHWLETEEIEVNEINVESLNISSEEKENEFEEDEDGEFGVDGESGNASMLDYLKWGVTKIVISEKEKEELDRILDEYVEVYTSQIGFVKKLIECFRP